RTDISAVFPRRGLEKHQAAGFFVRIHPEGTELIAGSYMPGPDELRAIRAYLASHHAEFLRLSTGRALNAAFGPLLGERLVRVPAPHAADHPAADLLRLKQFFRRRLIGVQTTTSPTLVKEITAAFRAATPFVEAIDAAIGNCESRSDSAQ
ncbi:MAG: DUF2461 domain-containing protein, partial [Gemmatimonadota bacterium]|nr:DUF2461 domain-containing protein [Gemmatimonadota bacterium]